MTPPGSKHDPPVIAGEEITDLQSLSRIENTVKQEISTASKKLQLRK